MTTFARCDFPDGAALAPVFAQWAAARLAAAIAARGAALLVVSGGRTPLRFFHALSAQPIDWSRVAVTLADERRVADNSPRSNAKLVREALLENRAAAASFVPLADARLDEAQELAAANARIAALPLPADVVALGMGDDGHTASLFPRTEAIHAMSQLVVANQVPQKDTWRITLTWPVINHASSVFFLIAGADKAEILREVLTGPRDPDRLPSQLIWPASGILTLILDQAAAAFLPATDEQGCGVLERER